MKIGVDVRVLMDKHYSGISAYTASLLKALLSLDEDNHYSLFYNSFHNLSDRISPFKQGNSEIVHSRYPNKFFNYFLQKIFKRPRLDNLIGGSDIFWSPHINFSNFSSKTKNILTVHDISFLRYPEFFNRRKNFWHRSLKVKSLLNRADAIVAVSENTKKDLVELLNIPESKVTTILSGLNEAAPLPEIKERETFLNKHDLKPGFLLYLGTIEPRKNISGLIYAYNRLRDENVRMVDKQLVLAGASGWRRRSIRRAWERSPYRQDIKFLGYVSDEEKEILYKEASVFVYPSYYEGFGFPPLEAMARGLPVVTSNVSSLPEVVADAAISVNPYDISEIAKALELILSDDDLRNKFIVAGRNRAKLFSWEEAAEKYLKLFNTL